MIKSVIGFVIMLAIIMFLVAGQTTEVVVVPRSTTIEYTPSSIELIEGTTTEDITDLNVLLDGSVYHITETTTTPGMQLDLNFTGITDFSGITARAYYDGATAHAVRIQMYNYITTNWDVIHTVNDGRDFETHTKSVGTASNYISGGLVQTRFYHAESGNPANDLYIDYFALRLS